MEEEHGEYDGRFLDTEEEQGKETEEAVKNQKKKPEEPIMTDS